MRNLLYAARTLCMKRTSRLFSGISAVLAKLTHKNPDSPPEPERVELDGIELAQYLCKYLAKKKILLLGHSWGSHLAVEMVQRRPELFAAYIGTGQVGSWRANVQAQFDFMLAKSRAANDRKKVELMEAIGTPDPNNAEQYFSWWRMRNPYMTRADAKWFEDLAQIVRTNPDFTEEYMKALGEGMAVLRAHDS